MRIPNEISIKGETWKIERSNLENLVVTDDSGQAAGHAVGLCDPCNKTIYIHKKIKKDTIPVVLLHEIGHAIFSEVGFNQTSFSSDFEEIIVENFANVLIKLFPNMNFKKPVESEKALEGK